MSPVKPRPNDVAWSSQATSAHLDAVLSRHRHQRGANDCGPFSAAMVIGALDDAVIDPVALAREMDRPRRGGPLGLVPMIRRVPDNATFPWGMADVLRAHGLDARSRIGMRAGELADLLDEGHLIIPIVGSWRWRPWAHYMVLLARNPARGWGFADPDRSSATLLWWDDALFARRWRAFANTAVVVRRSGAARESPAESRPSTY